MSSSTQAPSLTKPLREVLPGGKLRMNWHPGQARAWASEKRFVAVIAGAQSGKTEMGPHWLYREIRRRGMGDYLVASPTNPLLIKKALPAFINLFERTLRVGQYKAQRKTFEFSEEGMRRTFGAGVAPEPTQVFFGHATDPESLESATAKAAWLDEAGQNKFRLESWEAIQRRLAVHRGRALITTTPYNLGWLKQKIYDPWQSALTAGIEHADIDVVGFDSTRNPAFPKEEYERAERELPRWKFDLFYRGVFSRPVGQIYDSFVADGPERHIRPRFEIPKHWPRYVGLDFGATNTAAIFFAGELTGEGKPTGRLFAYREHYPGKYTVTWHAQKIKEGEPRQPVCVGGSASEDEWRIDFARAGLPVLEPPIRDVEVGINLVYACHTRGEIVVFDDLSRYLEEKATYSRDVDETGKVLETIADKSSYHLMDAERYIISHLKYKYRLNIHL